MKKIIKYMFSVIAIVSLVLTITGTLTLNNATAYAETEQVYLGGTPLGIIAESEGLIVQEIINVNTVDGSFSPSLKAGIKKGDVITAVNGERIYDVKRLNQLITTTEKPLIFTIVRDGQAIAISIMPAFDLAQNANKIGLIVKNDIAGIGTLTFIKQNGNYGALGHQIIDGFGYGDLYQHGKIYNCVINGYNRATSNSPGELRGKIDVETSNIGTISRNSFCGIFGTVNGEINGRKLISVGSKNQIKPGKAYICTTIDGELPQMYEIQIVKAIKQDTPSEKGMVIRVTDKVLLDTTGGILQGMSGSPILQDGKLVGAVTHVFTNDTTTGYGIYIDWMMDK